MSLLPKTIKFAKIERAWQKKYNRQAPKKGDKAPGFDLFDVEGKNRIQLSDFEGKKPVALVFGSFT